MSPPAVVRLLPKTMMMIFCFVISPSFVRPEFIPLGSTVDFKCQSSVKNGQKFDPILKRNDDHHKEDPRDLYVGLSPRPVIDSDWLPPNKSTNATTDVTTFHYHLTKVGYEDAGIYICDPSTGPKKNVTVIGDDVTCKQKTIRAKEGSIIQAECILPVDGPDEVQLDWYIDDEVVQSERKEVKPEHQQITTVTDLAALPEHHNTNLVCKHSLKGQLNYECTVGLTVTYKPQVKGAAKSVYHDDTVEADILVIGNPWKGKKKVTVESDDIIEEKTTMDELDNGLGCVVTVFVPLSKFNKEHEVYVAVAYDGDTLTSVPIKRPPGAKVTYIVVIAVLAVLAVLLVIGIIVFIRRSQSRGESVPTEGKDVPLSEQAA